MDNMISKEDLMDIIMENEPGMTWEESEEIGQHWERVMEE